jgi:hypothetical protein
VVRLALAVIVLGISGCGDARRQASAPATAAAPKQQLLFAFPKLGRLYADCSGADVLRLTYRANSDTTEMVTVLVDSKRVARRNLSGSLRFKVDVIHRYRKHQPVDESPPMKLVSESSREPYGTHVNLRFRLVQAADGSGECLAKSAKIRITSDLHLG